MKSIILAITGCLSLALVSNSDTLSQRIDSIQNEYFKKNIEAVFVQQEYRNNVNMEKVNQIMSDMTEAMGRFMTQEEAEAQRELIIAEMKLEENRYRYIITRDYNIQFRGYDPEGIAYDEIHASDYKTNRSFTIDYWNDTVTIYNSIEGVPRLFYKAVYPELSFSSIKSELSRNETQNAEEKWYRELNSIPFQFSPSVESEKQLRIFDISSDKRNTNALMVISEDYIPIEKVGFDPDGNIVLRTRWDGLTGDAKTPNTMPTAYSSELLDSAGELVFMEAFNFNILRTIPENEIQPLEDILREYVDESFETFIYEDGVKKPHPYPFN